MVLFVKKTWVSQRHRVATKIKLSLKSDWNNQKWEPNLSKRFDNETGLNITGYHASWYRRKNAKDGKKYFEGNK